MARALALAERGAFATNPNPMVGCVVVAGGRVVGEGHHARAGAPHAEVVALAAAGVRARGATVYVNLEPCSHHGRTPPCAPLLAAAGVKRVVAAMADPDPRVNGRGLRHLRQAGVDVEVGLLREQAALLNRRFIVSARARRPFVLLKAGVTLDARIATARGASRWITSPAQRRQARALRGLFDAVGVGIGTVLADDPLLLPVPRPRRPFVRVVFDSCGRLPLASRLARSARTSPVWLVSVGAAGSRGREARLAAAGVEVVHVARGANGGVDLRRAAGVLRARGIRSLMVEGGGELLGAWLHERLFDQVALFRAPLLLGGRTSRPAFGGPDPKRLAEARRLVPVASREALAGVPQPWLFELWEVPRPRGG